MRKEEATSEQLLRIGVIARFLKTGSVFGGTVNTRLAEEATEIAQAILKTTRPNRDAHEDVVQIACELADFFAFLHEVFDETEIFKLLTEAKRRHTADRDDKVNRANVIASFGRG